MLDNKTNNLWLYRLGSECLNKYSEYLESCKDYGIFRQDHTVHDQFCIFIEHLMKDLFQCQQTYHNLIKRIIKAEEVMDKKMHKVTKSMKVAEKDIKKGKPKIAVKVLKKAENKNEKLVKIDKNVRDPLIEKCKKTMKKAKKK